MNDAWFNIIVLSGWQPGTQRTGTQRTGAGIWTPPLCRFAVFGFSPAKVPGVLSYNHTLISHTQLISASRLWLVIDFGILDCVSWLWGLSPEIATTGFYTAFKKIYITPKWGFVRHGRAGLQGMKMRTNRNAWGMKFKAAGCGMITMCGIGN